MTIEELLMCARYNLVDNAGKIPVAIGAMQFDEAVSLLVDRGLSIGDDVPDADATPSPESEA